MDDDENDLSKGGDEMNHINGKGEFQSDKYDWCKPGFVPLKISDPATWTALLRYASKHRKDDPDFAEDLESAVHDEIDKRIRALKGDG